MAKRSRPTRTPRQTVRFASDDADGFDLEVRDVCKSLSPDFSSLPVRPRRRRPAGHSRNRASRRSRDSSWESAARPSDLATKSSPAARSAPEKVSTATSSSWRSKVKSVEFGVVAVASDRVLRRADVGGDQRIQEARFELDAVAREVPNQRCGDVAHHAVQAVQCGSCSESS